MAGFFMITIIATVKVEQSLQLPVSVWLPQYLQNKKCCNCRNNDVTAFWYLSLQRYNLCRVVSIISMIAVIITIELKSISIIVFIMIAVITMIAEHFFQQLYM